MLWYILRERFWELVKSPYRVLIGMVIFFIVSLNLPDNLKPPMLTFITAPAGWYAINRLIQWLIPGFSGLFMRCLDVLFFLKLLWIIFVLPIKFVCSMLLGPIAVLYVFYQLIRDVARFVNQRQKRRTLKNHILRGDWEKPRLYRVK
ncbi:hypothetical protein [Alicyclobacillus fodiniaquatilis]|uniref:Uncharacterized protein n=1 Tax=Alicyclobacillus fodiniaquatilis TaxID=1661150 RepID=A0ABW4JML7_9BACL